MNRITGKVSMSGAIVLSILLTSLNANAAQCTVTQTKKFTNPTTNGLRIDRCVQGAGWRLGDKKRCDAIRKKNAADAFCKTKSYSSSKSRKTRVHLGNHSIWTFKKGADPGRGSWTQVAGADAFREIVCRKQVTTTNCEDTRSFRNPTQSSLRIDKCVQGSGWNLLDNKRCDTTRRKNAADAFCKTKGFSSSKSNTITGHTGNHSIWTFRKNRNPANGSWTQVIGGHAFKKIVCKRPRQ